MGDNGYDILQGGSTPYFTPVLACNEPFCETKPLALGIFVFAVRHLHRKRASYFDVKFFTRQSEIVYTSCPKAIQQ